MDLISSLGLVSLTIFLIFMLNWISGPSSRRKAEKPNESGPGESTDSGAAAANPTPPDRIFTLEELARYDGTHDDGAVEMPCYLSVKGVVYDVSIGREHYGPNGGYSVFAAKDASVVSLLLLLLLLLFFPNGSSSFAASTVDFKMMVQLNFFFLSFPCRRSESPRLILLTVTGITVPSILAR